MYLRLTSFTASQFGHIFPPSPLLYPFNLLKHIKSLGNLGEPTGTAIIHNGENHRITAYHPCSNLSLSGPFNCQFLHNTVQAYTTLALYCTRTYNTISSHGTTRLLHVVAESKCTKLYFYSVFVFCSGSIEVATLDLSGSNAATSSIFLNCQGNRDGYRNGRMSKPTGSKKKQIQF